jgi:hypothetical protein
MIRKAVESAGAEAAIVGRVRTHRRQVRLLFTSTLIPGDLAVDEATLDGDRAGPFRAALGASSIRSRWSDAPKVTRPRRSRSSSRRDKEPASRRRRPAGVALTTSAPPSRPRRRLRARRPPLDH